MTGRLFLLGMLALLLPWLTLADDNGTDVGSAEQRLERLHQQMGDLQSGLDSAAQRRGGLESELKSTEQEIGKLARHLRVLNGSLQGHRKSLGRLRAERREYQSALAVQQDALARQMRTAYAMGRQERLKILLNQQDPAMVSRLMMYYDYFNRARTQRMAVIDIALEKLHRTEEAIAGEEQRLLELQARELEQQSRLEQVRTAREEVILALNAEIHDKGRQLKGMQLDEGRLQSLLGRLQQALADIPADPMTQRSFMAFKGKMAWPSKGRLTARFGTEKAAGLRWDGVIISSAEGKEVRAVYHGRVVFSDWLPGFGLLLIIDHSDGYMTLYGHNQSLFKDTGDWVEANETVALVGNSGGRLNAGVYFGIRRNGRPVNPKVWCKPPKGNRVGAAHDHSGLDLLHLDLASSRIRNVQALAISRLILESSA